MAIEPEKSIKAAAIISNREIIKGHFLMILKVPSFFRESIPGQFVMLRTGEGLVPFLGRPFSIHSIYNSNGDTVMEIFYRVSGKGTVLISRLKADDSVKILGPLGRGYDLLGDRRRVVLIAGGMGIAPLLYLAEYQQRKPKGKEGEMVLYFGALSSQYLCGLDRLKRVCSDVRVSTDDGSMGYHGPVTELFLNEAGSYESDDSAIYACGPYGMMKRVAEISGTLSIPCQVSVEERMACGIGACLGCAVREGGKNTTPRFKRVCKEGPVFDTRAIDWN